jgi:uncharacterized protein
MTTPPRDPVACLLHGVFLQLRAHGASLGIRDYLDAIEALRVYGAFPADLLTTNQSGEPVVAAHSRDRLIELCQIVWARTSEERRLIERLLRARPAPPAAMVKRLRTILDPAWPLDGDTGTSTAERSEDETTPPPSESDVSTQKQTQVSQSGEASGSTEADTPPTVGASFTTSHDPADVPLPAADGLPRVEDHEFILEPPTPISERFFTTCWRRYRRPSKTVATRYLDVPATIRGVSRTGFLVRPEYQKMAQNLATLLVFVDIGPAMAPWRALERTLVASLRPSLSRLREVTIRYFDSSVRSSVYADRTLTRPTVLTRLLAEHAAVPLLVFSDAGAARGAPDNARRDRLMQFLARVRGTAGRRIAWINPMPVEAWVQTPAESIAAPDYAAMLPATPEGMLRAVDILRGERRS